MCLINEGKRVDIVHCIQSCRRANNTHYHSLWGWGVEGGGAGVAGAARRHAILCRCVDEVGVEVSRTLQDRLRGVSPAGCHADPDDTQRQTELSESTASGFRETGSLTGQLQSPHIRDRNCSSFI